MKSSWQTSTSTDLFLFSPPPNLLQKTKTKTDISLFYTLTYAFGLAFNLAYLVLENALVGWIFLTLELALALLVIAAKLWLERGGRGKRDAEAKRLCAEQMEKEKAEAKKGKNEASLKGAEAETEAAKTTTTTTATSAETRV